MLLRPLSGPWLLLSGASWQALLLVCVRLPPSQVHPEVVDPPYVLPSVPDAYNVELDAEGESDLPDILASREFHVRLNLYTESTVIHDKCVEYSVESLMKAPHVFEVVLGGLNTRDGQWELPVWTRRTVPFDHPRHRYSSFSVNYRRILWS